MTDKDSQGKKEAGFYKMGAGLKHANIYTKLPVYQTAYSLLTQLIPCVMRMQRDYRYSLGNDAKRAVLDVMIAIYHANKVTDKISYIELARERLVEVRILTRLFHDMRQFSDGQYGVMLESIASISKQLVAWQRSVAVKC